MPGGRDILKYGQFDPMQAMEHPFGDARALELSLRC
jgi:hypothetical protein